MEFYTDPTRSLAIDRYRADCRHSRDTVHRFPYSRAHWYAGPARTGSTRGADARADRASPKSAHRRFRSGLEVEQAELRAEIDVILGREVELRRRAPTAHLDVVVLVPALWHGGVWDI